MAEQVAEQSLPDDMVEEIMSRLEPEPLFRFKSVSTYLNDLISSQNFMKKQLNQMKALNRNVFILHPEFCFVPLFYDKIESNSEMNGRLITMDDKSTDVVASSNGLILYCNLADEFFLLNPSTNQQYMLPRNKIVFPPGTSWAQVFFGMGYLDDEDDYKVVRIAVFNSPDQNTEVMIYSKNSGKWNRDQVFPHDFHVAQPGVYVHGRLHWRSAVFSNQYSITSFNLANGEYGSMCIPEVPLVFGVQQLVALDDVTLVLSFSVLYLGGPYVLWILKEYFDPQSWIKIQINTSTIIWSDTIINLQPLILLKPNGSRILFRLDPMGSFGLYDLNNKVFNLIDSEVMQDGFCTIYGFVPCLHSPAPIE